MRHDGKFAGTTSSRDMSPRDVVEPRREQFWWSVPERAETGGSMLKVAAIWFGCFVLVIAAVAIFG